MAENVETEKAEKTPLLKEKKPRPPQSEKQMQNFRAMQEIRAKKAEERKQAKILEAQRALLEKEGYVKSAPVIKEVQQSQPLQFEIEEEEEEEVKQPKVKARKVKETQVIAPPIQTPRAKPIKKVKQPVIESDTDTDDCDSDSSQEVIIIKRKSKKAVKRSSKQVDEEEEDYVAKPQKQSNGNHIDYGGFFC